jgi:hypothetical protein
VESISNELEGAKTELTEVNKKKDEMQAQINGKDKQIK